MRSHLQKLSTFLLLFAMISIPVGAYDIERDVVYGHKMGMALTYDVIHGDEQNGAAVLFMVSGGWISRWIDPDQVMATGGAFGPFGELVDRGYTLFLVRHGSSPMFKVPDAVSDVRRAVRHIRHHADQWGVDANRLGVFGGSAGGHLSLMLGNASDEGSTDSKDPIEKTSSRVAAVVAYFPPVDLRPIAGPSERFPALDFDKELADDVSPLLFVSADDPPTLLVHGDADPLVPLTNSQTIHAAFDEHNVATKLVVLEGAPHGFRGEHQEQASAELLAWFDRHLAAAPATQSTGTSN